MDLTPFKDLIKERCGLSFEDDMSAKLAEGINARMSKSGIKSRAGYFSCIFGNRDEFNSLINLLTINETYFFREPVHLQLLVEKLIPEMLAGKAEGNKIRILSAGCSSGEEPYSVVIAAAEKYGAGIMRSLSITGADIDSDAIARAEKGEYNTHSFRSFASRLKEKYFDALGNNTHRVKDFIRQNVKFCNLNLLSSAYPDALKGLDIIFYRNVAIYFDAGTQKSIFGNLASLLNEKGYLFVSSTETLCHNIGVLSLIERDGVFLYRKSIEIPVEDRRKTLPACRNAGSAAQAQRPSVPVMRFSSRAEMLPSDRERRKEARTLFDEALSLAVEKNYTEALKRIDELMEQDASFGKCYMLKASILINLNRIDDAEEVCLKSIETDQWRMEGYLLLGLTAKIRNNEENALKRFKEALYIESSCWPAHFYLADLYNSRGELENAYREYSIVLNLLKNDTAPNHGFTFWPLSFPVSQIIHVCNLNLSKLKRRLK